MKTIYVIEDDLTLGLMLKTWLMKKNFQVEMAINIREAKRKLRKQLPEIVLSDMRLPDGNGISLMQWAKSYCPSLPYILMTSYADIPTAVEAIKLGAFDYVQKPLNIDDLLVKIEQAITKKDNFIAFQPIPPIQPADDIADTEKDTETESPEVIEIAPNDYFIVGTSPLYQKLYEYLDLVAPTMMSVFILGESGVGKEHIAQLIHEKSDRAEGPFIAVDCGVLSRELAASEFFGHIKGSFTGAIGNKKGFFWAANGGTLFLDEVGNLPSDVQTQLLRTLQERKIRPVGSEKDIPVDVRVIAATNERIDITVPQPSFRLDLFYRLSEFVLQVPSVRECSGDIPLFLNHFLQMSNLDLGKNIIGFMPEAMEILSNYAWHGNIREIKSTVKRMILLTNNQKVTVKDIPDNIKRSVLKK